MRAGHSYSRSRSAASLGCFLAPLLLLSPGTTTADQTGNSGILTLSFDDAYRSQYLNALPVMQKYGLVGTLYISTGNVGGTTEDPRWESMSWAEIGKWREAGWEIGAHTHRHQSLVSLTDVELQAELGYAAALIYKNTGVYPVSFASPFGEYDEQMLEFVQHLYDNHASAHWNQPGKAVGFNSLSDLDPYRIGRLIIVRDTSSKEACEAIERASNEKLWLVLGFHGILPEPRLGVDGTYDLSVPNLERIAKCAAEAEERGILRVETVRDALALLGAGY